MAKYLVVEDVDDVIGVIGELTGLIPQLCARYGRILDGAEEAGGFVYRDRRMLRDLESLSAELSEAVNGKGDTLKEEFKDLSCDSEDPVGLLLDALVDEGLLTDDERDGLLENLHRRVLSGEKRPAEVTLRIESFRQRLIDELPTTEDQSISSRVAPILDGLVESGLLSHGQRDRLLAGGTTS